MSLNKWSLIVSLCSILLTSSCAYDFDSQPSLCGNAEVGVDEACDDGNATAGDGCSRTCDIEEGYTCPKPGRPCVPMICGDGKLEGRETCDDANATAGDGCSSTCQIEDGYTCPTPGEACVPMICGNGKLDNDETCDDGNATGGDGCSTACQIEIGYTCPTLGQACGLIVCGDGKLEGGEKCDDGNATDDDGCSTTCQIEDGYTCPMPGAACGPIVCGDGKLEGRETCDDANSKGGDGCSSQCKTERGYTCPTPGEACVVIVCGNGKLDDQETCDDGNAKDGDGCSTTCQVESGYKCTAVIPPPESITIPVIYRDFRSYKDTKKMGTNDDGYITHEFINKLPKETCILTNDNGDAIGFRENVGHPDFENTYASQGGQNLVKDDLGPDKKPVFNKTGAEDGPNQRQLTCKESFDMWFNDTSTINRTLPYHLNLALVKKPVGESESPETYVFDIANPTYGGKVTNTRVDGQALNVGLFTPLTNSGYGSGSKDNNFNFTAEIHSQFRYRGGEKLAFASDDDLWVFINKHLVVDIGGKHGNAAKDVTLKSDICKSADGGQNIVYTCDEALGLVEGQVYDINIFYADRGPGEAKLKLSIPGLEQHMPSKCTPLEQ